MFAVSIGRCPVGGQGYAQNGAGLLLAALNRFSCFWLLLGIRRWSELLLAALGCFGLLLAAFGWFWLLWSEFLMNSGHAFALVSLP